jgi:hypothetical protein
MPSKKQQKGQAAELLVRDLVLSKTPLTHRPDLEQQLGRGPHKSQIDLIFSRASTVYLVEVKSFQSAADLQLLSHQQLQKQRHFATLLNQQLTSIRWFLALVDLAKHDVVFLENPC